MIFNFLTWNVQGLGDPRKVCKVFAYLRRYCVDIALLQETHLTKSTQSWLRGEWLGENMLRVYSAYV